MSTQEKGGAVTRTSFYLLDRVPSSAHPRIPRTDSLALGKFKRMHRVTIETYTPRVHVTSLRRNWRRSLWPKSEIKQAIDTDVWCRVTMEYSIQNPCYTKTIDTDYGTITVRDNFTSSPRLVTWIKALRYRVIKDNLFFSSIIYIYTVYLRKLWSLKILIGHYFIDYQTYRLLWIKKMCE